MEDSCRLRKILEEEKIAKVLECTIDKDNEKSNQLISAEAIEIYKFPTIKANVENDNFINKITNSHTLLLNVKINSNTYKGEAIATNDDLFYYYKKTKGYSLIQYKEAMKKIYGNLGEIRIKDENFDLDSWDFNKVSDVKSVKKDIEKGEKELVRKYFKKNVLNKNITIKERSMIVSQLFKWKIITKIDDETGYLFLPYYKI